jgi:hypothetical protein
MKLSTKQTQVMLILIDREVESEKRQLKVHMNREKTIADTYKEHFKNHFIEPHKERIELLQSVKTKMDNTLMVVDSDV